MNKKVVICFILLVVLFSLNNNKDSFQNYMTIPYHYVKTGTDPLQFYVLNRYRKPYRWPYKVFTTYPTPHMKPYLG